MSPVPFSRRRSCRSFRDGEDPGPLRDLRPRPLNGFWDPIPTSMCSPDFGFPWCSTRYDLGTCLLLRISRKGPRNRNYNWSDTVGPKHASPTRVSFEWVLLGGLGVKEGKGKGKGKEKGKGRGREGKAKEAKNSICDSGPDPTSPH